MSDTRSIKDTPTIQKVLWRKRWQAFAVVSLASFLLISMLWPLATRGYKSRAEIEVDVAKYPAAVEQFKSILDTVVLRNLSENALKRTVDEVRHDMPSKVIDKLSQAPSIRPMFEVKMAPKGDNGSFVLSVQYSGKGTQSENHLLNLITTNVARDFLANPLASMGAGPKREIQNNHQEAEFLNHERLANAQMLRENANQAIANLEQNVLGTGSVSQGSDSPFMTASSQRQYSSSTDSNASVELGKLRQTVQELTSMIEHAHDQQSSTNGAIFSVREVRSKSMEPIGCNPKWASLALLGIFSGLLGLAVAFNFHPFEERGFQSVSSIASHLGIPVAATLNSQLSADETESQQTSHWANIVVSYSELFLFAITIIVLGFCLINTEIREAFTDNLFHGFSRIFWMFRN
ncbi:hypothetical protein OAG71_03505 [bacterium]|nr:hypothetical protein [bacterium]